MRSTGLIGRYLTFLSDENDVVEGLPFLMPNTVDMGINRIPNGGHWQLSTRVQAGN